MAKAQSNALDCPMCLDSIAAKLGITKALLLKIYNTEGLVKVNGYSLSVGKLIPYLDDSDGFVLGYSGMASCGHMLGSRQLHLAIPMNFTQTH